MLIPGSFAFLVAQESVQDVSVARPGFLEHLAGNPSCCVAKGQCDNDDVIQWTDHRHELWDQINWRENPQTSEHDGELRPSRNTWIFAKPPNRRRTRGQETGEVLEQAGRKSARQYGQQRPTSEQEHDAHNGESYPHHQITIASDEHPPSACPVTETRNA